MLESFTRPNRRLTIVLLVVAAALLAAAGVLGISDNPPGLLLAYAACAVGVVAFVHPWRTARKYWYLAAGSALGLGLFAVLHNLFDALGGDGPGAIARYLLQPLGVGSFLVAVLLCPAGFVVGVIGALVTLVRNRLHPPSTAA